MRGSSLLLLALVGCAPKPPPPAAPTPTAAVAPTLAPTRLAAPGPLADRPWTPPQAAKGTLKNGIPVYVVENHETPFVQVRLSFGAGTETDPKGKEGLAQVTMSMLTRGAGSFDVEALNKELKRLGSDLNVGAGGDDAAMSLSSLTRNLAPTLDLATTVLTQPTFPAEEWALLEKQYRDGITSRRQDPNSTARTVLDVVTHGPAYQGRVVTERSLDALTIADMKAWRATWLTAKNAAIFVGGDTTLDAVLPLLDARFGSLPTTGKTPPRPVTPAPATGRPLALVDKPGAAQSVILASRYMGAPTDPDFPALYIANQAWGGDFTARLNMNLREEKGYTYGARSSVSYDLAGTRFRLSTSVQADKTIPAIQEILGELSAAVGPEPLTAEEIANVRGQLLESYPLPFENPGELLGLLADVRLYGLGDAWISSWLDRVRAVTPEAAQAAWKARADGTGLYFVVVGDAATLREPIRALGFTVEERDADGVLLRK